MSLWPGIPQFQMPDSSQKLQECFSKISLTGKINDFTDITSTQSVVNDALQTVTDIQKNVNVQSLSNASPASELNSQQQFAKSDSEGLTNKLRVRLVPINDPNDPVGVTFLASPTISENRAATWDSIQVVHHPGEILAYKTTTSRTWEITEAKLISRTSKEAAQNLALLNKIRSWVMPYYGYGTEKSLKNKLGSPPSILTFSGYGSANIGPVPVVLISYGFNYQSDMEMIPCDEWKDSSGEIMITKGTPFPIISSITLSLKECFSPREFSSFDIVAYKTGDLPAAYNTSLNGPNITQPKTSTIDFNTTTSELVTAEENERWPDPPLTSINENDSQGNGGWMG